MKQLVIKYRTELLVGLLGLLLIWFNLIVFSLGHNYTSDDVALQVMFDGGLGSGAKWFGISSFIFKLPFIYLGNLFSNYSKFAIFLPTLIVVTIGYSLFITSFFYFVRRLGLPKYLYIMGLWVATLSGGFVYYFFNLNSRNIEIGIIFASLALAHYYLYTKKINKLFYITASILLLLWAIIITSDTFYLYMFMAPVALFAGVRYYRTRTSKYLHIGLFAMLSSLSGLLISKLLAFMGFSNAGGSLVITGYSTMIQKLIDTPYILINFIGASFFGDQLVDPYTVIKITSATVLVLAITLSIYVLWRQRSMLKQKFYLIFCFIIIINYLVWLISDKVFAYYFILIPFLAILGLLAYLSIHRDKKILILATLGISVSIILNLLLLVKSLKYNLTMYKTTNSSTLELTQALRQEGYTKGYSPFWGAGISTFLSNNNPRIIQTKCNKDRMTIWKWYLSEDDLYYSSNRSFVALNNNELEGCSKEIVLQQFGEPLHIRNINSYTIFFYDYDILEKIK